MIYVYIYIMMNEIKLISNKYLEVSEHEPGILWPNGKMMTHL